MPSRDSIGDLTREELLKKVADLESVVVSKSIQDYAQVLAELSRTKKELEMRERKLAKEKKEWEKNARQKEEELSNRERQLEEMEHAVAERQEALETAMVTVREAEPMARVSSARLSPQASGRVDAPARAEEPEHEVVDRKRISNGSDGDHGQDRTCGSGQASWASCFDAGGNDGPVEVIAAAQPVDSFATPMAHPVDSVETPVAKPVSLFPSEAEVAHALGEPDTAVARSDTTPLVTEAEVTLFPPPDVDLQSESLSRVLAGTEPLDLGPDDFEDDFVMPLSQDLRMPSYVPLTLGSPTEEAGAAKSKKVPEGGDQRKTPSKTSPDPGSPTRSQALFTPTPSRSPSKLKPAGLPESGPPSAQHLRTPTTPQLFTSTSSPAGTGLLTSPAGTGQLASPALTGQLPSPATTMRPSPPPVRRLSGVGTGSASKLKELWSERERCSQSGRRNTSTGGSSVGSGPLARRRGNAPVAQQMPGSGSAHKAPAPKVSLSELLRKDDADIKSSSAGAVEASVPYSDLVSALEDSTTIATTELTTELRPAAPLGTVFVPPSKVSRNSSSEQPKAASSRDRSADAPFGSSRRTTPGKVSLQELLRQEEAQKAQAGGVVERGPGIHTAESLASNSSNKFKHQTPPQYRTSATNPRGLPKVSLEQLLAQDEARSSA